MKIKFGEGKYDNTVANRTIDAAAAWMRLNYSYMTFMQRHPEDEPQIVGVWL